MSSTNVEIDIDPIFLDRRKGDRRMADTDAMDCLVDRRNGCRRSREFNTQQWWLQCKYLDTKTIRI